MPLQHGVAALIVRETSRFKASKDPVGRAALWTWANRLVRMGSLSLLTVAIVMLFFAQRNVLAAYAWPLFFAFALVPIVLFGAVRSAVLIGLRHVALGQLPEYVIRPLVLIFLIALMQAGVTRIMPTASLAMLLYAVAATISLSFASAFLKRVGARHGRRTPDPTQVKNWYRALGPLVVVSGVHYFVSYSDLLLLGILSTSKDVGLYRAASQTALFIPFVLQAVNAILAPIFAGCHHRGDTRSLQEAISRGNSLIVGLTIPLFIVVVLFGAWILGTLFGAEFGQAYSALCILAVAQFINVLAGPVAYLLTMTGHESRAARVLVLCAALNLVLNVLLIPRYGLVGAAVASALSISASNLIMLGLVKNLLSVDSSIIGVLLSRGSQSGRKP